MASLLRLNPIKPLRFLRNGTPLGASFDLRTTTRLTNGPTQFGNALVDGPVAAEGGYTLPSTPAGALPTLQLTSRTPGGITRGPRVNVSSRRQFE